MVFPFILLFVSWFVVKDWSSWRQYYPTILFTISVNLICSVLTYEHSLWHFHKALFIPNHTFIDFYMKFTSFPLLFFMYLSRYPYKSRWMMQTAYITLWAVLMSLSEGVFFILNFITYHNGWNFGWSVLFWLTMYPTLRLHHTRPLLGWLVFVLCAIFVIPYFHIPITQLK
ncbi:CBO0543 family protein [Paenibacillus alginolyticus]|uniref:CBO0543 family protein n=1 Tax=Paenibacillus alginolyticus TaxID=59839 RepID=UPI00398B1098